MTIEPENSEKLPPLKIVTPPMVPVEMLVAVAEVRLMAGDVPPGILRAFYQRVVGLTFISADADTVTFSHHLRRVVLERTRSQPGRLGLLIKGFSDALIRLRTHGTPYELLHTDGGMTRTAILRDPAGNWVHLVETRPF